MVVPTIHLNGTSRDELLRQYVDAVSAIDAAIAAMNAAAPHQRDYYPQGHQAFRGAYDAHKQRLDHLFAARDDTENLALAISLA